MIFLFIALPRVLSRRLLAILASMQLFMPQVQGKNTSSMMLHPLPQYVGIQTDVEFWERIYSRHDSDQCLLVDEKNLYRVFAVVDLPRGRWSKKKKISRSIGKIKRSLRSIAKNPKRRLSATDTKVKTIVSKNTLQSIEYKNTAKRLRCQRGMRDSLKVSFQLAQSHLPAVKHEIKQLGMPVDLAYLPYLESGYRLKARSPVGARGLWQLMPATAREAGLKINRRMDQRLDVHKSTRAALSELKKYRENTKSWGLALTSYVYGHNGMMRAIEDHKTNSYVYIRENYETKIFQFSSKNYYPRFLAIRNVMQRSEKMLAKKLKQNKLAETDQNIIKIPVKG